LDLASALIKLSRFALVHDMAALTTGLAQNAGSGLNVRIERLVMWDQIRIHYPRRLFRWYLAPSLAGAILPVVMTYGVTLSRMHELTEWLVR
jgi:hypothetical protein